MRTVCLHRLNRASVNAGCILALPACRHENVFGPISKRILLDLNTRQRVGDNPCVSQSAGHHAGTASLAFFQIHKKKTITVRYGQYFVRQYQFRANRSCKPDRPDAEHKLPPC
jgi:hypothetical protein